MTEPRAVLLNFMREMHGWEKECARRTEQCIAGNMDFDEAMKIGAAEYTSIFERHCSPTRAIPRDFFFTEPPDYDPVREIIVSECEQPGLVEIRTQQNYGHAKTHLFRLALEGSAWKLVDKRIVLENGESLDASL